MKAILLLAVLLSACTTVKPTVGNDVLSKGECEVICTVLGYEVREVRNGNCICNLSKCIFKGGCVPLPPPPEQ